MPAPAPVDSATRATGLVIGLIEAPMTLLIFERIPGCGAAGALEIESTTPPPTVPRAPPETAPISAFWSLRFLNS